MSVSGVELLQQTSNIPWKIFNRNHVKILCCRFTLVFSDIGLTCFACYVRAVFRAIVLIPNPDEQSITDYIMNGHTSAKRPIIKTVINFLLINHMIECKSEYIIFGNDDDDTRADETRVALEEHSPDVTEASSTETSSTVRNDSPRHVNDNRHVVARSNFVCDVCNRPCLSAAGLVSHRRVHRS
ncbi:uncharacterized protein LOC132946186 [Metopolophium dirhodum]|uniref:uncharacterized protein LOC132946186 n=1 Tax=Metopolophium dirhodum TaxID=44670 RepID=UPI0029902562|nr:uncharacterized protein LOC132946186 [Metopolophium dirhodum]